MECGRKGKSSQAGCSERGTQPFFCFLQAGQALAIQPEREKLSE